MFLLIIFKLSNTIYLNKDNVESNCFPTCVRAWAIDIMGGDFTHQAFLHARHLIGDAERNGNRKPSIHSSNLSF